MTEPKTTPLSPRKVPKQQRSIALVAALKETCLRILRSEGADGLTVARLGEESGVAITSIYEYFPTIEAVVGAVLRSIRQQIIDEHLVDLKNPDAFASLHDYLLHAVRSSIHIRLALAELHREIYRRHVDEFDTPNLLLLESWEDFNAASPGVRLVMERFRSDVTFAELDNATYMTVRMLQVATRAAVLERDGLLGVEPDMDRRIAATLHRLLTA
jgi:AcrR family transcriptional regulator